MIEIHDYKINAASPMIELNKIKKEDHILLKLKK